jgi:hypothetical protein
MAERIVADSDGPWKEALRRFFPVFLALLFPKVYADINWRHKFEFLRTPTGACTALAPWVFRSFTDLLT